MALEVESLLRSMGVRNIMAFEMEGSTEASGSRVYSFFIWEHHHSICNISGEGGESSYQLQKPESRVQHKRIQHA